MKLKTKDHPTTNKRPVWLHIIFCVLSGILIIWSLNQAVDGRELDKTSDANWYVKAAYNLQKYHTYSPYNQVNPEPSGYREPAFSTYLALAISMNPNLQAMGIDRLLEAGQGLKMLRQAQIPILVITAFLAMFFVTLLTKKIFLGYIALFLTGLSSSLLTSAYSLKHEHFIALFALLVALLLYKTVGKQTKKYFALLGAALGLLVLSRAVFMYLIIFVWVFLLLLSKAKVLEAKKAIFGLLIMTGVYVGLVGGWMLRNYVHFNKFYICGRGGVVLSVRAQYDTMNKDEYFGSFLYWTTDNYVRYKLMKDFYGQDALGKTGILSRLNRSNPDGHYRVGRAVRNELIRNAGVKGETAEIDKKLRKIAMKKILSHPFKHILVTLPIGWRGIFAERAYMLMAPFSLSVASPVVINFAYFGSLLFLVISSLRKRRHELFAITLPAIYLYGMNSFFTHNIPRYTQPNIPIFVVILLTAVHLFITQRQHQAGSRKPGR